MTEEEKKKSVKEKATLVVTQLPTEQVRNALGNDGKEYELVTIEEAITEILEKVRKLERVL